ncbi:MAG: DUF3164 family protein [Sphaerochaetaceae bacterium]|nr:DUF3164 family protein [Spirochaetales bacterium]MDY5500639.1 DUF3164 family protein [Sphaerochaetaceae bacterium]
MQKEIDGKTYYVDATGRLVPSEMVPEYDKIKDQTVECVYAKLMELRQRMLEVKADTLQTITDLKGVLETQYGVRFGDKNNMSFTTIDGRKRLRVDQNTIKSFDEKILVAKAKIDALIEKWSEGSNVNLVAIVKQAFELDQSGNINVARVLSLRRLAVDDPGWKEAMDLISDSFQPVMSKQYLNMQVRQSDGRYAAIDLNFARM